MTGQFPIPALRKEALGYHDDRLLALVEAVEAGNEYREAHAAVDASLTGFGPGTMEGHNLLVDRLDAAAVRLDAARYRFDFGEET